MSGLLTKYNQSFVKKSLARQDSFQKKQEEPEKTVNEGSGLDLNKMLSQSNNSMNENFFQKRKARGKTPDKKLGQRFINQLSE